MLYTFLCLQLLSMDSFPVTGPSLALDLELWSDLSAAVWLTFGATDPGNDGAVRLSIENGRRKE